MNAFLKNNWPWIVSLLLFALFKSLYPYPDVFLDSTNYIQWGLQDLPIAFRPLGYTHFLMAAHDWGAHHFGIVFIQFAVHIAAAIFFCKTLFRIWNLIGWQRIVCYVLILFNPLAWFIFNLISPDSLFISLSAVWLATLLRFFFLPDRKWLMLAIHVAAFIGLFYLRYNAIYYPFFGAAAVWLTSLSLGRKALYAGASLLVFAMLYTAAAQKAEIHTGEARLSGFGGWAMANNALHVYYSGDVDATDWEEPEEKELDQLVRATIDSVPHVGLTPTDQFLWARQGPLKQYLFYRLSQGRYPDYMQGWWQISGFYNDFGKALIMRYPGAFFRYFYGPNLASFFFPSAETLEAYDVYGTPLLPEQAAFLGYQKDGKKAERIPGLLHRTVKAMEGVHAVLSVLTILAAVLLLIFYLRSLRRLPQPGAQPLAGFLLASFYILTVLLLAFAHPILLRYVLFPLLYFSPLPLLWLQQRRLKAAENAPHV